MVGSTFDEAWSAAMQHDDPTYDSKPWREIGWLFRDRLALAMEGQQGGHTRAGAARFARRREG